MALGSRHVIGVSRKVAGTGAVRVTGVPGSGVRSETPIGNMGSAEHTGVLGSAEHI